MDFSTKRCRRIDAVTRDHVDNAIALHVRVDAQTEYYLANAGVPCRRK